MCGCREAASAGKFTHMSKISIFAPQRRLIAQIHVKLGTAEGYVSPFGRAKFHDNRCPGVHDLQNGKNFHFLVNSRPAGAKLWPISTTVMGFFTPTYHALVFHIWRDSLHRLRSHYWETARRWFSPKFSVHSVGKLCVGSKMIDNFLMISTSCITVQSLEGEIVLRAPAGGAKIWCLYLFVCLSRSESGALFDRGDILWTAI